MMLRGLGAAVAKDLRLLVRDRAGLVFLTVGPVVVITVAGLSLATLYGAQPVGAHAHVVPLVDEDAGSIGQALNARLAGDPTVELRAVPDRDTARALVRGHTAGAALVIPRGTSTAMQEGRPAPLLLFTDPVKNFEVATVRAVVQEFRHAVERVARAHAQARVGKARAHAARARARFEARIERWRDELARFPEQIATAGATAERRVAEARARAESELRRAVETEIAAREHELRDRLTGTLGPLRGFLTDLDARQQAFAAWLAAVRDKAGRFADRLPPPPTPPAVPPVVAELAHTDVETLVARLLPPAATPLALPPLPRIELPAPPVPPALALPALPELPDVRLPSLLGITETSVTGAPQRLNTFDQNVPGFSVTFLMLGMLLGVSLGLLDERDWGTLERLRAMPTPFATSLIAKLLARFVVGVVQMVILFTVGWAVFGVSLGPQPWALLLPTAGIVFAGTAFGLIVAAVAHSREAVLPVGSVVIVTMAAVGGCWWPMDLEPEWMRRVALGFPTTWAMAAFNDLMIRRQPIAAVLRPTAVLFAYGAVYLAVGLALFRRQATSP